MESCVNIISLDGNKILECLNRIVGQKRKILKGIDILNVIEKLDRYNKTMDRQDCDNYLVKVIKMTNL